MSFVSYGFALLLLVTFLAFVLLPARLRKPLLLAASYVFYATWSVPFIAIILLTTTVDFWMSRVIHESRDTGRRKAALVAGLVINLAILAFFKYANFGLDTAHGLAHWLGWSLPLPAVLDILLPLGISFYTFEAISYMVDVYRGKDPAPNWLDYNFYIMYFPHLISGPIVRFGELFPQYAAPIALPSAERLAKGVELVLLGYAFKVLIADQAAPVADALFATPAQATAFSAWLGVLAFTVQIYFDFMGYTHIARGVSLLLNIEMPLNFNHPYLAGNIGAFWERWHMSLSRWIRDYLYIPLGGSRGTLARTVANLMITMLLCGAWHGAGWTFVAWGGYHGLLLSANHGLKSLRRTVPALGSPALLDHPAYRVLAVVATFVLVMAGWVLFRATDFSAAATILARMADLPALGTETLAIVRSGHLSSLGMAGFLLVACFSGPVVVRVLEALYRPLPGWLKVQAACGVLLLCWILAGEGTQPFIYFQF